MDMFQYDNDLSHERVKYNQSVDFPKTNELIVGLRSAQYQKWQILPKKNQKMKTMIRSVHKVGIT